MRGRPTSGPGAAGRKGRRGKSARQPCRPVPAADRPLWQPSRPCCALPPPPALRRACPCSVPSCPPPIALCGQPSRPCCALPPPPALRRACPCSVPSCPPPRPPAKRRAIRHGLSQSDPAALHFAAPFEGAPPPRRARAAGHTRACAPRTSAHGNPSREPRTARLGAHAGDAIAAPAMRALESRWIAQKAAAPAGMPSALGTIARDVQVPRLAAARRRRADPAEQDAGVCRRAVHPCEGRAAGRQDAPMSARRRFRPGASVGRRQDVPPSNPASHPPRSLPGRRARPGRRNRPVLPAAERPAHIWPRNCAPLFQNGKMRCPQKPGGLKRMRGAAPCGPLSPRQRPCRAAPPAAPLPQTTPPATSSGRSRPRPRRRLPHHPPEPYTGLFDRIIV